MEFLYPLTVEYIGFLSVDVLGELSIGENDFKSSIDEFDKQVLPIQSSRFHGERMSQPTLRSVSQAAPKGPYAEAHVILSPTDFAMACQACLRRARLVLCSHIQPASLTTKSSVAA